MPGLRRYKFPILLDSNIGARLRADMFVRTSNDRLLSQGPRLQHMLWPHVGNSTFARCDKQKSPTHTLKFNMCRYRDLQYVKTRKKTAKCTRAAHGFWLRAIYNLRTKKFTAVGTRAKKL